MSNQINQNPGQGGQGQDPNRNNPGQEGQGLDPSRKEGQGGQRLPGQDGGDDDNDDGTTGGGMQQR